MRPRKDTWTTRTIRIDSTLLGQFDYCLERFEEHGRDIVVGRAALYSRKRLVTSDT
jgi:hypothetical protein